MSPYGDVTLCHHTFCEDCVHNMSAGRRGGRAMDMKCPTCGANGSEWVPVVKYTDDAQIMSMRYDTGFML